MSARAAFAFAAFAVAPFAVALLVSAPAHAFDASHLELERSVEEVNAPGLYRADVDPELYRHARRPGLADLRLVGPDGDEVPWLVRPVAPLQAPVARAVLRVDAVMLPDGAAGLVLDLGPGARPHSEVQLVCDGPANWSRPTRVDASDDGAHWTRLAEGAWLFRVDAAARVAEHTTLDYPRSTARYLRVLLLPAIGPPVRLGSAVVRDVPAEARVPLRILDSIAPAPVPLPGGADASDLVFDLGAPGVPVAELALDVADTAFERRALLAASPDRVRWSPLVATLLYRVAPAEAGKLAQENVRIGAAGTRDRFLRVTLFDAGARPLTVRSGSPAYAAEELVFRAPAAGTYTLYLGGDVPAPRYGLADELLRTHERPTRTALLGTIAPNPTFGGLRPPAAAGAQPSSSRSPHAHTFLLIVIAALLLALGAFLARRRTPSA